MSRLLLSQSREIIGAALAAGNKAKMKPLAVIVLDAGGHVMAFEREDGSSNLRFEIAHGKAYGAIGLGIGSRAIMERALATPHFVAAANGAFGGALIPVPGGVLIRTQGGDLIGAVGVSGDTSDNDELAAKSGIEAAGLVADCG